jgi:hypothetical protein
VSIEASEKILRRRRGQHGLEVRNGGHYLDPQGCSRVVEREVDDLAAEMFEIDIHARAWDGGALAEMIHASQRVGNPSKNLGPRSWREPNCEREVDLCRICPNNERAERCCGARGRLPARAGTVMRATPSDTMSSSSWPERVAPMPAEQPVIRKIAAVTATATPYCSTGLLSTQVGDRRVRHWDGSDDTEVKGAPDGSEPQIEPWITDAGRVDEHACACDGWTVREISAGVLVRLRVEGQRRLRDSEALDPNSPVVALRRQRCQVKRCEEMSGPTVRHGQHRLRGLTHGVARAAPLFWG